MVVSRRVGLGSRARAKNVGHAETERLTVGRIAQGFRPAVVIVGLV